MCKSSPKSRLTGGDRLALNALQQIGILLTRQSYITGWSIGSFFVGIAVLVMFPTNKSLDVVKILA